MAERFVLDPDEVAVDRTELDITDMVGAAAGVDWGDAEVTAYMAEGQRGSTPVDYRVPNRTITIPLMLKAVTGLTFAQARARIQAKVALIQAKGGWLKRETAGGDTVYCDLVNATLKLGGGWMQAHRQADPEANLVLEALPDFYGDEVELGSDVATTAASSAIVRSDTGVEGHYPARCRVEMTNFSEFDTLGLVWGVRSVTAVDAASTRQKLVYNTVTDWTVLTDIAGPTWTAIAHTDASDGTAKGHVGSYRAWVRVYVSEPVASGGADLRLLWDVGDLTLPVENEPVRVTDAGYWLVDLGEVRLDESPVGVHRWRGVVQARALSGVNSTTVVLSQLSLVPVDDGYGVLRGLPLSAEEGLTDLVARDHFLQSTGALASKTAPVGGDWDGGGDADDFAVDSITVTARRSAVSDTASVGRSAWLTPSPAAPLGRVAVQVDSRASVYAAGHRGVIARVNSASASPYDKVRAMVSQLTASQTWVYVGYRSGGVETTLLTSTTTAVAIEINEWVTTKLMLDENGLWEFWVGASDTGMVLVGSGQSDGLATGLIETGKVGIYDEWATATAATRDYKNFRAWVPENDAVAYADESYLELRTDGAYRSHGAGGNYGPVSHVQGDLPRLPVAGLEGRTTQLYLRPTRSDGSLVQDLTTAHSDFDLYTASLFYRPCWLFLPE